MIKEKETFFSVLEDNPHGIAVIGHKDRYLYVNPEFTEHHRVYPCGHPGWQDWIHEIYGEADGFGKALESNRTRGIARKSGAGGSRRG